MPKTDLFVLLTLLLGTPALVFRHRRGGARGRRLFAAGWTSFYGLALTAMMATHCVDVLANVMRGAGTRMDGLPWAYDFRLYSLLLLGVLLTVIGVRVLRTTPGLARGDAGARRDTAVHTLLVLGIALPLIPIHAFFAYIVTTLSALTLLVLGLVAQRRSTISPPGDREAGVYFIPGETASAVPAEP